MRIWPATARAPRRVVTLVLAATGLLANCGQKGALVLPGPETTTAVEEGNPADEDNDAQDSE